MKSHFEQQEKKLDKLTDLVLDQHVASLEHDTRQPRLAIEADGPANKKTREYTEGAAKAVQAMHGDSCFATRVDPGPEDQLDLFRRDGRTSRSPFQG